MNCTAFSVRRVGGFPEPIRARPGGSVRLFRVTILEPAATGARARPRSRYYYNKWLRVACLLQKNCWTARAASCDGRSSPSSRSFRWVFKRDAGVHQAIFKRPRENRFFVVFSDNPLYRSFASPTSPSLSSHWLLLPPNPDPSKYLRGNAAARDLSVHSYADSLALFFLSFLARFFYY